MTPHRLQNAAIEGKTGKMRGWGIGMDGRGGRRLIVAALLAAALAAPAAAQFESRSPATSVSRSLAPHNMTPSPATPVPGFASPGASIVAPGFGAGVLGPPLSIAPVLPGPSSSGI